MSQPTSLPTPDGIHCQSCGWSIRNDLTTIHRTYQCLHCDPTGDKEARSLSAAQANTLWASNPTTPLFGDDK